MLWQGAKWRIWKNLMCKMKNVITRPTRRKQTQRWKAISMYPLKKLREPPPSITYPSTTNHEWHKLTRSLSFATKRQGLCFLCCHLLTSMHTIVSIPWLLLLLFPTSFVMLFTNAIVAYKNLFCIVVCGVQTSFEQHFYKLSCGVKSANLSVCLRISILWVGTILHACIVV